MPASSKEFLDIQATIEFGFTLKRVPDMTRTYSLGNDFARNVVMFVAYETPSSQTNNRKNNFLVLVAIRCTGAAVKNCIKFNKGKILITFTLKWWELRICK